MAAAHPEEAVEDSGTTQVRLARDLTLTDATLLGVGALMGGGIFVMPGIAAAVTGPSVWVALALNALATLPTLLVYAELASAYHDTGGGYLWVKDSMGPGPGFVAGWMSWFSHAMACGLYALASASYFVFLLGYGGWLAPGDHGLLLKVAALGFTILFVALNYVGVKLTARAENATTIVVLGTLVAFVLFGLAAVAHHPAQAGERLHLGDVAAVFPFGAQGILLTMGLTFIAFEGYEIIAQAGEEVKNARRNVPRAIFLSLAIVAPLLVLVGILSVAAVQDPAGGESWRWLSGHAELGLVLAAQQFLPYGALIVLFGAMLSNLVALNSTIYSSSRVSFAMARDRALPAVLARVSPRSRTPDASILFSGALIAVMATTLPITAVAAAADIMFLMLFFLVNVSYIKLRKTTKHMDYGFRAPWFPYVPIAGLVTKLVLAVGLYLYSPLAWAAAIIWLAVGGVVFLAYGRRAVPTPPPETAVAVEEPAPERRPYQVLLPIKNPESAAALSAAAADLARAKNGAVVLLHVIEVPRTTVLDAARDLARAQAPMLAQAARRFPPEVPVHRIVKLAHDAASAILETAEEEGVNLILLGWRTRPPLRDHVLGSTLDPVVREAPCDVAVLRPGRGQGWKRVVLTARGRGRHAKLGAELAATLAKARGVELHGVTVTTAHSAPEAEARLAAVVADAGIGPWDIKLRVLRARSAEQGLMRAAGAGDLLVIGASEAPSWRTPLFGSLPERIAAQTRASVMLVKRQTRSQRSFRRLLEHAQRARAYLRPDRL